MSPAPIGRGHMPIPNLLGQTASESIRFTHEYRHKGTSNIYVDVDRDHCASILIKQLRCKTSEETTLENHAHMSMSMT